MEIAFRNALEIDSNAGARLNDIDSGAVTLETTNRRGQTAGQDFDCIADLKTPGSAGSGDDGPETLYRKDAINGQAEGAIQRPVGRFGEGPCNVLDEQGTELVQPVFSGKLQHWRVFQEGALKRVVNVIPGQGNAIGIHEVALGEDDQAASYADYSEDVQVFACLGHDSFVGSDHEHGKIESAGAGNHVTHETLVTRCVDNRGDTTIADVEMGESQLDGDSAILLFLESVGVHAGDGLDDRSLAVVDVACRADDEHG